VGETAIEVVHVGSVSRDVTEADARGWRLGGGVAYAALTTARFGLRTAAVVGADALAATAAELDLLREAGADLRIVQLAESPVFRNMESPEGRTQACLAPGHRLPLIDVPVAWGAAPAWSLVPVAGELDDGWAAALPPRGLVALGWQGWLRTLVAGRNVERRPPEPSALLRRADLVAVSRHDLAAGVAVSELRRLLGPAASLLVTDGEHGGRLLRRDDEGVERAYRYEAVPAEADLDPTGAGDVFLGALVATLVRPSIVGEAPPDLAACLAFAAAAASLVIERPGLLGVPDPGAVRARDRRARSTRHDPD
jgi:sugar/nucleoside kinase (ribokinase family)